MIKSIVSAIAVGVIGCGAFFTQSPLNYVAAIHTHGA